MSLKQIKSKKISNNIIYTIVTVIILSLIFLSTIGYIHKNAEDQAFEQLHMETKQIKEDIQLQIMSDRENLSTMASFASQLYSEGKDFHLIFDSFKSIGLIGNVGILLPDNTFITKAGRLKLDNGISFEQEAQKGEYTSGRVKDITNNKREVIRNAVPIRYGDTTVGILYGIIELGDLETRYSGIVSDLDAQLYVYESGNGNFIIDTFQNKLENISILKDLKYKDGYSYEKMMNEQKGYSSFMSRRLGQYLYIHYSPLEIADWHIMLARTESDVFKDAQHLSKVMFAIFMFMVAIMAMYLLLVFRGEKRKSKITMYASETQKMLLDINQQQQNITHALQNITLAAKARSAFFVDTDGEDFNYISPSCAEKLLMDEDRNYFVAQLISYSAQTQDSANETISVMCIRANSDLERANNKFFKFIEAHKIKSIYFAAVRSKNNHISILGVINPKKNSVAYTLLTNISICFSIAIYNKKYLDKTKIAASTDSLTGLSNRVAYNKAVSKFNEEKPQNFACIFIDINELHLLNNRLGHAAGDEMLVYIANTLKEVFFGHSIFRYGGDEFIVFMENTSQEVIKKCTSTLTRLLEAMDYHIAIGVSFRTHNTNTEEIIRDAEVRMYEAKAQYYQNKENAKQSTQKAEEFVYSAAQADEFDTLISVLQNHYKGIYHVSLKTDAVNRILMPAYLGYNERESNFKKILTQYINKNVNPDFHRAILSFLNYDALKKEFYEGNTPKITYKKIDGSTVVLSVYPFKQNNEDFNDTLWIFENVKDI